MCVWGITNGRAMSTCMRVLVRTRAVLSLGRAPRSRPAGRRCNLVRHGPTVAKATGWGPSAFGQFLSFHALLEVRSFRSISPGTATHPPTRMHTPLPLNNAPPAIGSELQAPRASPVGVACAVWVKRLGGGVVPWGLGDFSVTRVCMTLEGRG